jgi:hypothetical protein
MARALLHVHYAHLFVVQMFAHANIAHDMTIGASVDYAAAAAELRTAAGVAQFLAEVCMNAYICAQKPIRTSYAAELCQHLHPPHTAHRVLTLGIQSRLRFLYVAVPASMDIKCSCAGVSAQ